MPPKIPRSLECNGRLPPLPAHPPSPHPTPAAPHPPRRGKRRVPRFGTWRWCRRPPKPSTRTPCGKIPPKSPALCPCLTRSRAPSPGCCWRLQQRIRLTAPTVLAGVGGRVRRLPLSSTRLSSVAGRLVTTRLRRIVAPGARGRRAREQYVTAACGAPWLGSRTRPRTCPRRWTCPGCLRRLLSLIRSRSRLLASKR